MRNAPVTRPLARTDATLIQVGAPARTPETMHRFVTETSTQSLERRNRRGDTPAIDRKELTGLAAHVDEWTAAQAHGAHGFGQLKPIEAFAKQVADTGESSVTGSAKPRRSLVTRFSRCISRHSSDWMPAVRACRKSHNSSSKLSARPQQAIGLGDFGLELATCHEALGSDEGALGSARCRAPDRDRGACAARSDA